jgi:hypothetical protein
MSKEWIDIMKQTKRLKLSRWQTLSHFFVVLFFLFIPVLSIFSLFKKIFFNTYEGLWTAEKIISITLPWLLLAFIFYLIQKRKLGFKEFKVQYSEQEFQEAIKRTVKDCEWKIELNNKNLFRAHRAWNWSSSWGEVITIIKDNDLLLLNSICDPNTWNSITSYGWNKRNINTFKKNLHDVKSGLPYLVKIEKQENELTFKKVVIRLIAYPF